MIDTPPQSMVDAQASAVWSFLEREGGINERLYDSQLVSELRSALGLSAAGQIAGELARRGISVEQLIRTFFSLTAPFAAMATDILVMFEKAAARRTGTNLRVAFDFNKGEPLRFDLDHFRDFIEVFERARIELMSRDWPRDLLWRLYPQIPRSERAGHSELQDWAAMIQDHRWPDRLPSAPASGNAELDAFTATIWPLVEEVVGAIKRFALPPGRLYSEYHGGRIATEVLERAAGRWDIDTLCGLDSDYWATSLVLSHDIVAKTLATGGHLSEEAAEWLKSDLPQLAEEARKRSTAAESLQRRLAEILNLPVWRQRHQVYSVWVASRILDALDWDRVTIYPAGDELRFEFRQTHLASTRDTLHPNHLMAELRTPLRLPLGKSRIGAIQPDYRLVGSPIHDPASHRLVVECKQYLRPSRRNFVEALTDYARGAPKALVVLVNYSEADEPAITDAVPIDLRARTAVVAPFRPGEVAVLERFRQIVQEVVGGDPRPLEVSTIASDRVRVELQWQGTVDLDLHVFIGEGELHREHLYYRSPSASGGFAQLSADIQTGPGIEWVDIAREDTRPYRIVVHKYGGALSMRDAGPVIRIHLGPVNTVTLRMTPSEADAWSVCRIFPNSGRVEIIDRPGSLDDPSTLRVARR
jgi:hypothetical protein